MNYKNIMKEGMYKKGVKMTREEAIKKDREEFMSMADKCKFCGRVILYPDGVNLRRGMVHRTCLQERRAKRG